MQVIKLRALQRNTTAVSELVFRRLLFARIGASPACATGQERCAHLITTLPLRRFRVQRMDSGIARRWSASVIK